MNTRPIQTPAPTAPGLRSAAPAAAGFEAPAAEVRDQVSLGTGKPAAPRAQAAPAAEAKPAAEPSRPAPAAPPTTLFMQEGPEFQQVGEFAVATVAPEEMAGGARQALADEMLQYLGAWPSVTAVVSVAPGAGASEVLVAGRPDAIAKSRLEGVYDVVQHLSSSPSIKESARRYPTEFHTVKAENAEGTVHSLRLPGPQDANTVAVALSEGGQPNKMDLVRDLVQNLPRGKRVALLIAGPSAAGKSTLIKEIKKFAAEVGRTANDLMGDMYFKDVDQPNYPKTATGSHYWDHVDFMDIKRLKEDIGTLIATGEADTPVYNFQDVRPGGWRMPGVTVTGFREDKPKHISLGAEDILIIDSLHAANEEIVSHLSGLGLEHATVYLDSPQADDRLLRRITRDYAERGGRLPKDSFDIWDLTTWPGEKDFVRPTILQMDPARDVFLVTKFPKDLGLSRAELETRSALLAEYGLPPTYEAYGAKEADLPAFAKAEEQRLAAVAADPKAEERDRSRAQAALERLRQAPRYQG